MKILWFTNTPSLYDQGKHHYNGVGWVESLEKLINNANTIELAVSFFHPTDNNKISKGETTYYPMLRKRGRKNPIRHLLNTWSGELEKEKDVVPKMLTVIEDFKPDIIHVFGTENSLAHIQKYTKIPVIIHLQGIINPILNAYFPQGHNLNSLKFSRFFILKNSVGLGMISNYKIFKKQARRETEHLKNANYLMGRTDWDKLVAKIYNPNVAYFHVDEVLRPQFYEEGNRAFKQQGKIIILSTLSPTIYKGIDVLLKTAKLLKETNAVEFEWNIVGLNNNDALLKFFASSTNINPQDVNVNFLGKKNPEELQQLLNEATLFIHPSYIDNSPNSVCEAQLMGVPVIACHVGGVSSLIEHQKTGILVPSNGIFEIVSWVIELANNSNLLNTISQNSKQTALARHNKVKILNDLIKVYQTIKDS